MRTRLTYLSLLVFLTSAACRSSSDGSADAGPTPDGGGEEGVAVQDVQDEAMEAGTAVSLRGVVVTAIDNYGDRRGSFYVQEPEGGPMSGVAVFVNDTSAAGLAVGDLIDVEDAVKAEFALEDDKTGRKVTQLVAPQGGKLTISKVGTGQVPEPPVLDPWALAADDVEAEKWEGVPVAFENVRVLRTPSVVGSGADPTFREMLVTGPFRVQSALAELPDGDTGIQRGDCYQRMVGIVDYFFDYKIQPRSADDLVGGGTDCLPVEDTEALCTDGADNDYNGFADCDDLGCAGLASCTVEATVVAVQDDTIEVNKTVTLSGVVVTAIDEDREHLWVQDEGVTAPHNGVYVYRGKNPAPLAEGIVVGARVDIVGRKADFFGSTQVADAEVTDLENPGATITVITDADPAVLADQVTGAPYEGTLVRLENLTIIDINPDAPMEYGQFLLGDPASPVWVDDTLDFKLKEDAGLAMDQCLRSITGVMILNTFEDRYTLAPRGIADIDTSACE